MGNNKTIVTKEIEIGHLDLKYTHTRILDLKILQHLTHSIECHGQINPIIVAPGSPPSHILIDGYLRVAALKRCGKDTVLAEIREEEEQQLLVFALARTQDRKWDVFEQASIIRELHVGHEISQAKIAALLGKDQSWISRRLAILDTLDEKTINLIRKGHISTWGASRVLVPMARANSFHASVLTTNIEKENMSTRDLVLLFKQYQKSGKRKREEIVNNPRLFLNALKMKEDEKHTCMLKEGPEGKWLKEIRLVGGILRRLEKEVPVVFYEKQNNFDRRLLLTAFEDAKKKFLSLNNKLRRCYGKDDIPGKPGGHSVIEIKRNENSSNQPSSESVEEYGSSSNSREAQRVPDNYLSVSGHHAHNLGSVPVLQG